MKKYDLSKEYSNRPIKVLVLSKLEFNRDMMENKLNDENIEDANIALISINGTSGNEESWFKQDHSNVLRLWFDDVITDIIISPKESYRVFTQEQADKAIDFIQKNKKRNFIIHCAAGISRSGSIGRFIVDYLEGDREYFEEHNKHILPNPKVSQLLYREGWKESKKN